MEMSIGPTEINGTTELESPFLGVSHTHVSEPQTKPTDLPRIPGRPAGRPAVEGAYLFHDGRGATDFCKDELDVSSSEERVHHARILS